MGLPWYGGRPRKLGKVLTMAERAVAVLGPVIEATAVEVVDKPVEAMNPAELLGATSLQGLRRLHEIVSEPLDPDDLKQRRLVGDMAVAVNKLFMRAAEGEFRARRDDALGRLLALIAADPDGKGNP